MLYNVALFVHVVGAIGYFVALGVVYACVVGLREARTVGVLRSWAIAALRTTRLLLPLSGLCILIAGIYMVVVAWGDRASWAGVALLVFVLLGIATGALQIRRIAGLLRQVGASAPEEPLPAKTATQARSPLLWLATNAITATLVGIVFLMTVKPDVSGSLAALGIALAVGLVVGLVTQRQPARVAAAAR
jgi:hypothetical protein